MVLAKVTVLAAFIAVAFAATEELKFIPILHQESEIEPDGRYHWNFESGDGIKSQQDGYIMTIEDKPSEVVSGSYEYPNEQGKLIKVTYTAGKDGFHPEGDVIPKIPAGIQKSLDYLATLPPQKGDQDKNQKQ